MCFIIRGYHPCYCQYSSSTSLARVSSYSLETIYTDFSAKIGPKPSTLNPKKLQLNGAKQLRIWPSLIEKAYAKIHTLRFSSSAITEDDMGGWEAIGGGGKVEDALADLTGGVAGRFYTKAGGRGRGRKMVV